MADEDDDGEFQEFACHLKGHFGGNYGQKFHHGHDSGGNGISNWQRGRGRGFFNKQRGHGRGFHSRYGGNRSQIGSNGGFWTPSNVEETSSGFNNRDPQHHYNNEGNVHVQNRQIRNERNYGCSQHNPQFYRNRFRGRGRWKSNGNHPHGHNFYQHGVSGNEDYEDIESSQCYRNNSRGHLNNRENQGNRYNFAHSYGKMVGRGFTFRSSFRRMGAKFGNKALSQFFNSNKGTANVPQSVDLHVDTHDECKGDGIDAKTCSKESLPATKIDGFAPSTRNKVRKSKAASFNQSPLNTKCASQSPASTKSEPKKKGTSSQAGDATINIDQNHQKINPKKEGTRLEEEAVTINDQKCPQKESEIEGPLPQGGGVTVNVDERHRERAFISCIGGSNRKRRRSAAVRDFPVGCGSLQLSVAKKIKPTSIDSKAAATDSVVTNCIEEVASLSKMESMIENSSNLSISDVHVELEPKHRFGNCNRTHVTKSPGVAELLQFNSKICTDHVILMSHEGDTSADLVQAMSEVPIKSKMILFKGRGHTDLVQASLEENYENCSKPVLAENNDLLEPAQAGPESNIRVHTKTGEIGKNDSTELVQSDLQVSNKECNAKINNAEHIGCNGHSASQPSSQLSVETSQVKMPAEVSAVAASMHINTFSSMHMHASSKGIRHSVVENKKKKYLVKRKAETKTADGPLKTTLRQIKLDKLAGELTADLSTGLHNRGKMSKKPKVLDFSGITEGSGALVPYQNSNSGDSIKDKDCGGRLYHKVSSRVKHFLTSKSLESLMDSDPTKGVFLEATEGGSARSLVKRTLQEYESVRKALVKSQDGVRRADLDAASLLKVRGKWRNCGEKIVGEVPGVEVGDQFSFRMEMLIIGLHRQVQSGIDYIPGTRRSNGAPLATSIVASGGYEDDKDDGNTLIYSGHGGNNNKGNKKQESNQALVRGNLAMSNSMKEGTPVRVIRGITDHTSPSSKIYTYDGLYDVINLRFDCGATGYGVYHFTLTRRAGQPQVGLSLLSNLKKKGLARPYLLLGDISRGQERLPVCVVNEVDEETAPLNFTYIPKIKLPVWYTPLLPQGCSCIGVCDEETCSCVVPNGNELPYNEKGYILRDKDVVYECGISCSCSSSCQNRVSQKGLRYRLEIFKTENRGWGVRSLDPIQPGGFICEYTGELLTDAEAEQKVENDEYLFDLGNGCNPSFDQLNLAETDGSTALVPAVEDVAYTIDAKDFGNVARFINHSCSPNLYAQNVLYDSDDLRFPHVMLFAMENIPPLRELTYDYNYRLDQVHDAHGNVKSKACYCGAQDCQGRLY